jgi:outer membrane protein assembly factor BamB
LPEVPDLLSGAVIHDLIIEGKGEKTIVLAGCEDGRVVRMDGRGEALWEFRTAGSVHNVSVTELTPGRRVSLAGSDDEHIYALDLSDGREIWSHRAEVFPQTRDYPWWTLDGKAKVRSILAADFDGDGRVEIAIGTGGMQVEMLTGDGSLRWRRPVHYGLPVRLFALPNSDSKRSDPSVGRLAPGVRHSPAGPLRLLAGMDFLSSQANIFSFLPDGTLENADAFPSGRTGWDYTGISGLALIGTEKGKAVLAVGRSGAYNDVSFYDTSSGEIMGKVSVGDSVSGIVELPAEGKPAAVVATDAGWVMSLRPDGQRVWAVPLPDSVIMLWPADYAGLMARGENSVVAYCRSGEFFIIEAAGKILARGKGSWPAAMLSTSQ